MRVLFRSPQCRVADGDGRRDRPGRRRGPVVGRRRPWPRHHGRGGDGGTRQRDGRRGAVLDLHRPAQGTEPPVSAKKSYPLRINADVLAAAQRWADDELRSLNAQIEYVLRESLRKASRLRSEEHTSELQSLMRISYAVFCLQK